MSKKKEDDKALSFEYNKIFIELTLVLLRRSSLTKLYPSSLHSSAKYSKVPESDRSECRMSTSARHQKLLSAYVPRKKFANYS